MGSSLDGSKATTSGTRISIVCAEFNGGITFRLLTGALDALEELGGDLADVTVAWVPGAFELPLVAQRLAGADTVDAVICLGAVIRGDTGHYEFVAGECASGLQRVQLDTGKPVVFGVLTTETVDQALDAVGGRPVQQGARSGTDRTAHCRRVDRGLRGLGPDPGRVLGGTTLMLRLVLPKGSLEAATLDLFAAADLSVIRASDVDYRATIDDPRVSEVRILRPQEIPLYVADGLFDVGITGRDWIEERGSDVATMGVLRYSKATEQPIRVVLAVPVDSSVASVADLAATATGAGGALRVSTEYPELTRRYLESHGVNAEVSLSYGATEAKVPDIADCVVEITETGRALRAAGLKIVETLLVSHTELIANPTSAKDPEKNHAIQQLLTLLQGALEARGRCWSSSTSRPSSFRASSRCCPPSGHRPSRSCSVAADTRSRR